MEMQKQPVEVLVIDNRFAPGRLPIDQQRESLREPTKLGPWRRSRVEPKC
jgi:hypothetical protein